MVFMTMRKKGKSPHLREPAFGAGSRGAFGLTM